MSLSQIESLTKTYADSRQLLADAVAKLNLEIETLQRQALPAIKRALGRTAEHQAAIHAAIDAHRDLFVKPRTVIFHGIKLGLEKGKGKIEIDDHDRTMALIRKHLPAQADTLIKADPYVSKTALKNLTVAELKLIGCAVEEAGDQIIIRPTDKDVDRLVSALLKTATEEAIQSV